MRKYLLQKKSSRPQVDEVTLEKESNEPLRGQIGIIELSKNQLGEKTPKPKFKNNPNKVLVKKRRR